jgi:hypothetical protein
MIRLDIAYEKSMSLRFDLWIILRTIPAIIAMVARSVRGRLATHGETHHSRRRAESRELPAESSG